MKWRAARRRFVSGRGGRDVRGKKSANGRCGKTIEAQPVSGQTCLIEPAQERPTTAMGGTWTWGQRHGIAVPKHCNGKPVLCPQVVASPGCDQFSRPGSCPLLSMWFCRAAVRRPEIHASRHAVYRQNQAAPESCGHRSAKPGSFRPPGRLSSSVARTQTAELRIGSRCQDLPIAAHVPSSRSQSKVALRRGKLRMRGVIDANRQAHLQIKVAGYIFAA
ncbi:hypothetical protein ACVIDN_006005 [Rhizobium brockwellii]